MREMWIVIQREFRERVRSRAFVLSTILVPAFILAILLAPYLAERGTDAGHHRYAIVDATEAGLGDAVAEALRARPTSERDPTFAVEVAPLRTGIADSLAVEVAEARLDGYLVLGDDVLNGGAVRLRARNVTNFAVLDAVRRSVSQAVQSARLDRAGLDASEVAGMLRSVPLETGRITRRGEAGADTMSSLLFAYVIAFLLYMLILMYGAQVMQSVHEEKTNRIAEVLVSSIRSSHLLAGKILGLAAVALVQIGVWGLFSGLAVSQRGRIAQEMDLPVDLLAALAVGPGMLLVLALYAILGFFVYAALYAAVGAATSEPQEGQQFAFVLVVPLLVPLFMQFQLVANPMGGLARVVSWIPLTSPIAMPIRMGATDVPIVELIGSLAMLALGMAAVSWVAGKIYRVGMLSTGKRPTLRELARWIRST